MYLIEICFGEYDDYSHVPIMLVNDVDEAMLICDAIENRDAEYMKYVYQVMGDFCTPDLGAQYTKLPVVSI